MATYQLTAELAAAYAKVFDFRAAVIPAARRILKAYGIDAFGPGDEVKQLPSYMVAVDFQRGSATGRTSPVALGGGRYFEYSEFFGTLVIMNEIPFSEDGEVSPDHLREVDRVVSLEDAIFMQHVGALAAELPLHDVVECMPIDPDERPVELRETNRVYRRWRLKIGIRPSAWPTAVTA